jgi:ADP-ribose pyrophosphatase YjhB (NUDIX family)
VTDQPLIAIDVVPVSFSTVDGLGFGLAERRFAPFEGELALPGVLLNAGERLQDAAYRALETKTGVGRHQVRYLAQIGAFDGPGRDPREHAISISFAAVVGRDAGDLVWQPNPEALPFDHDSIVAAARNELAPRLFADMALTRALLGNRFTTPQAVDLAEDLTGVAPRRTSLTRSFSENPALRRTDGVVSGSTGRPSMLWEWV